MTSDNEPEEADESTTEPTASVQHTWSAPTQPSTAVIEALAASTGRDPTAMPPLYDYVDPDALDALLGSRTGDPEDSVTVSFAYDGVAVRVASSGWVEVR
ncbi:HalOD1 output domain-containing protein [Halorubrum sp. AD140]|uniref:HalOD1 output domain-containing protein n=1 Tax=Halorubrum sp. AD140 TaxID=3050073 RepID=UPI002ACCFC5F|nr:HalOD1 output domain-containing protein [Halorubrum sp. AD140]MDZ5812419.1 HalOD1 output domain-containing protein [Halorubrum sp. AD140]